MFAKIIGAILLVAGIGMSLSSIGAVVVGTVAFIALAFKVALVAGPNAPRRRRHRVLGERRWSRDASMGIEQLERRDALRSFG